MYLIRVIPLKRKIPGGELSYVSKDSYKKGSLISVPLKNSTETALVISCKKVSEEKSYIKSLPFKLLNIRRTDETSELPAAIVDVLEKFSIYSLSPLDAIVRALFGKSKKSPKIDEKNFDGILAISSREKKGMISFHSCIGFFLKGRPKIREIFIDEPEKLSDYGLMYLGFDPVVLLISFAKELKIPFRLSSFSRIRYKEFFPESVKLGVGAATKPDNLFIVSRQEESHEEKALALSPLLYDELARQAKNNKRILCIATTKGFSPKTSCADCGTVHACQNCKNPLRLVKNGRKYAGVYGITGEYLYVCLQCKIAETAYAKCRNCDSWHLIPLGYGTERIKENLEALLPKKKIYDFTERVSVKEKKAWDTDGGVCIANLETMRDIDTADICIVPSLAGILYGQSFEAAEKARHLLKYAENCQDKMIVFTMQDLERGFLMMPQKEWQKNEEEDRKAFHYPPYARYLSLALDPYASKADSIKNAIQEILKKHALSNSVTSETNSLGQITLAASFDLQNWSIANNEFGAAEALSIALTPFEKHVAVKIC